MPLLPKGSPMLYENHVHRRCPSKLKEGIIRELQTFCKQPPWGSCVGMAAPQLGYPYNVFVALGNTFSDVLSVEGKGRPVLMMEGCFSLPQYEWHKVPRYSRILVRWKNESKEYDGFLAQVIQHEFDHVRGKLINDRKDS